MGRADNEMPRSKTGSAVDLVADVRASLDKVAALCSEDKARAAQALWEQVLAIQELVAMLRAAGVQEMRARGDTLLDVATALGLSITRVKQIEARIEKPDRKPKPPASEKGGT